MRMFFVRMLVLMLMFVIMPMLMSVRVCVLMRMSMNQFVVVAQAVLGDGDFDAVNARPRNIFGADVPALDIERSQISFHFIERRAAVEQGGQSHIARNAAEAIEIRNFHKG